VTRTRAVLAALAFAVAGSLAARAGAADRAPARVFVNAKEWSLILSRQSLKAGQARIQLFNGGEDAHDLRLRRIGGTRTLTIGETAPGEVSELRAVLRPGKWRLWCSLPRHANAGMRATLTVTRA
jgi:hypothetical protein